jgi:hypothetical protein
MTESPFSPARSDALDKGRVKVGRCKNVFSRDSIIQCQPERRAEYLVCARILSCRLQVQASLPYLSKLWARIWGPRDPFLPHLSLLFSPDPLPYPPRPTWRFPRVCPDPTVRCTVVITTGLAMDATLSALWPARSALDTHGLGTGNHRQRVRSFLPFDTTCTAAHYFYGGTGRLQHGTTDLIEQGFLPLGLAYQISRIGHRNDHSSGGKGVEGFLGLM